MIVTQHPEYIQRIIPKMDHIKTHLETFSMINPPALGDDIETFLESLKTTSNEKLDAIMDRMDYVEDRYKKNMKLVHKCYDHNEDSLYLFTRLEVEAYKEIIYLKRWLKYWSKIYERSHKKKLVEEPEDRLTEFQIDDAKLTPIESLFNEKLIPAGIQKVKGRCPFHKEKTPSFIIFIDQNTFHCFGACSSGGDVIDFYMRKYNCDFVTAVKELLQGNT